jgi:hypothetical protein
VAARARLCNGTLHRVRATVAVLLDGLLIAWLAGAGDGQR